MAKRRKRGRKMPAWRKTAKAAIGIFGKSVGILVVAAPAIQAIRDGWGAPENIPRLILHEYTGYGTAGVNWVVASRGIASVVGGILLMKLFSYVARSV